MCGIIGYGSRAAGSDAALISEMRDTMRHRGPDDAGKWTTHGPHVGLGQRRLAVIDLSPGGQQPMLDGSGQLALTFNGEIYNYQDLKQELQAKGHQFRTASDTEVILEAYRAWGVDCVHRFNGMFAYALYDAEKERLFLARDRAGEKPLFYRHAGGKFVFASELKALMADPSFPRVLDVDALNYYLTYGYVPGDMCILKGVKKLPQGHAMTYDVRTDDLRVWSYWKLPEPCAAASVSSQDLVDEFEALLLDSVRRRMIADVPLGVMLSGGVDSSLVTAMAARTSSRPVKTFNISFPGHGAHDEAPYARMVARHFGTEHVELAAEPATVDLLPELARQYDEPLADSSMIPTFLLSKLIRQQATVAIGGDGGDELFGGYKHYGWLQRQDRVRRLIPWRLRQLIGSTASNLLPVGLRGRNYLIACGNEPAMSIAHVNLFFDARTRNRLLAPVWRRSRGPHSLPEAYKAGLCRPEHSLLQQATMVDFMTYLVDDILVKVDRASMLTSLEVRTPFLDPRIIEFAYGRVPDSLRCVGGDRKILLRRLAERLLPREMDLRRKQGFAIPLAAWFKGDWGRFMVEVMSEADPDIFDQAMIQRCITGQRRGLVNTQRLFAITLFELWRRHYRVTL